MPAHTGDQDGSPGPNGPGDRQASETILDGGVSSDIRIVHSSQGNYVVKHALEKLRVEADWHSDPARSSIEVDGLRTIAALLGQAHAPRVLWSDASAHRFAMELIDPRYKNWKQLLLGGDVDLATARSAGRLLGLLHARSSTSADIARRFTNTRTFVELRIRPFFERVAERNPALAPAVTRVVERIQSHRNAWVHGDYSPKNLLVDGADVVILDCEVAHWGDARFDIAFCVTHLLLKSFRRDADALPLLSAAAAFLTEYRRCGLNVVDGDLLQQIGCLMLARLEGDSPVDYLRDLDAYTVKRIAIEFILSASTPAESNIMGILFK
ncbi:MAG: aminoglycoside phosphotransferase family protein [Rudaea sp.]|uniref:aminoglycoside phosphotransferase family protein n=1 Tax=unclassified Rudaea TaxID=2627037 RepID=UPI0010FA3E4A|nr:MULTISPECIES: aminoglycoside phosphotransferase family protein [unclassified Rudaea]MBN8888263.1 aminoglycoside phosphotransferase family protein [Rudaea sp.]MBR0344195.1 aminoglycoside phosphotransferase family protein [Rudaea sp.]